MFSSREVGALVCSQGNVSRTAYCQYGLLELLDLLVALWAFVLADFHDGLHFAVSGQDIGVVFACGLAHASGKFETAFDLARGFPGVLLLA